MSDFVQMGRFLYRKNMDLRKIFPCQARRNRCSMDLLLIYPSFEQPSPGEEVSQPESARGEKYLFINL